MIRANISVHELDIAGLDDYDFGLLKALVEAEAQKRHPPVIKLTLQEQCLIECGHIIPAIQSVRKRYQPRPSLRQAKDACDNYRNANMVLVAGRWQRK